MLSFGRFPAQPNCGVISPSSSSQSLLSTRIHRTHFSVSQIREARFSFFWVHGQPRKGSCVNASNNLRKGGSSLLETEGFDDEDFFIEGDNTDEDEDDEVIIPLKNMKQWLEDKPRGFGEAKVYDTSIEDKLMEEIEQSRTAQLANVNKLKNSSAKPVSSKEPAEEVKASKALQEGFRVRVVNLPKKKNIHKDLKLAFEGISGILDIIPAVSGNKKTRDPVCQGFAVVDFMSEDEASRFVKTFSGKSITFGKVQKQIRCEMINSRSSENDSEEAVQRTNLLSQEDLPMPDGGTDAGSDSDVSSSASWGESFSNEEEGADEEYLALQMEHNRDNSSPSESVPSDGMDIHEGSANSSSHSNQLKKKKKVDRKKASKSEKEKIPKLKMLGAAKRLKIRDKAVLSGVLSKYGINPTSAAKEQS